MKSLKNNCVLIMLFAFAILSVSTLVSANDFRLEIKLWNDGFDVHLSEMVVDSTKVFSDPGYHTKEQTALVKQLFNIKGVRSVTLKPYEIKVETARVFKSAEIASQAEKIIRQIYQHK